MTYLNKMMETRCNNIVKFFKMDDRAIIPCYQTEKSSGFDFCALESKVIGFNKTVLIRTGLAVELPANTELQIRARSGLSLKTGLRIANSPGTIDEDYRGEIQIIVENVRFNPLIINAGDRIAQGVIQNVMRPLLICCNKLSDTKRGDGGMGHTGLKSQSC